MLNNALISPQSLQYRSSVQRSALAPTAQAAGLVALKLELRVIVSNSTKSLDFIGVFGITLGALALMTTIWFSVLWLTLGVPFAGFGTLMGVILLAFAALFFALRVIAQYLSLIVEKVKSRPSFIVEDSVGYEK